MRLLNLLLVVFFLVPVTLIGQTTIWSEDFSTNSNNDFTGDDNNLPVGADWTTSCGCNRTNTFRVESGEYRVENTDEYAVWTSEIIDISGYTNVSISIDFDMDDNQFDPTDCYHVYYNLDNSGNTSLTVSGTNGNECDDGADPTVASQTGLSGSTLVIRIEAQTTNTNEDMHFDNIVVTGESPLGKDGPGGVGDTDGSGSMVLWLDANQGVSTSGTSVTQWSDQSGYTNHCTPPGSGNRPTYNSTGTNSHPIITFDGGSDYLTASDDNSLDLTNWSIIVIGKVNTHKNYNAFVVKGTDANENYEFLTNFPGTGNFHYPVKFTDASRSTDSEAGESFSNSVYGVYQLDYDQSNFEMHINGDHTESDAQTKTPQTNSNSLYIGNEQGTSRYANASFCEVMIFNTPINTAQRYIIHNAMAAKYGFSMDANDLYNEDNVLNGNYDYDVAGIGKESDGSHEDAQGTGIIRMHSPSNLGNGEYLIWGHNNGDLNSFGIIDIPLTIQSRLARVWRASETGEVGSTTITVDLSSVAGSITASDLRLLVDANGIFALGASLISGATHLGSNVYQWTGVDIDNNDYFTIGSINVSQTPLPVDLVEFKATPNYENNVVDLFWVTSSEINNDYFTVEKTKDLVTFNEVIQTTGQGTTNERTEYREVDNNPTEGISYYRLSQTDFDGKTEYFNLEKVLYDLKNHEEDIHVELYPNPNNGHNMYMKIPNADGEELNLLVNDFLGKSYLVDFTVINEGKYSVIAIEMNQKLSPGVYMINVNVGDENHCHKLIVQ